MSAVLSKCGTSGLLAFFSIDVESAMSDIYIASFSHPTTFHFSKLLVFNLENFFLVSIGVMVRRLLRSNFSHALD